MEPFELFSPSKINLVLAITGLRADGFHDLVSLVAPLAWGDTLTVSRARSGEDALSCDFPGVPTDHSNLILKAAAALRTALPSDNQPPFVHFNLEKKTPAGAGLGGGSGNAAAALLALNRLLPKPVSEAFLEQVSAQVGSDCPLFIKAAPVVMRGRGERLTMLSPEAQAMITGRRVCIFKPSFGINTGWAYGQMKAHAPAAYAQAGGAVSRLEAWLQAPCDTLPLFNNMQDSVFEKYVALPVLLDIIRERFQFPCLMSGSGSACFALPADDANVAALRACVEAAWGPNAWIADTTLR